MHRLIPFLGNNEGDSGFPVRLRPEIGVKPRITEPQSAKKKGAFPSCGVSSIVVSVTVI